MDKTRFPVAVIEKSVDISFYEACTNSVGSGTGPVVIGDGPGQFSRHRDSASKEEQFIPAYLQPFAGLFTHPALFVPAAFIEVGGYNELIRQYFEKMPSPNVTAYDSDNNSCSAPRADAMHMFR